ncbi:MAG: response regulator [Candidatus Eisenbacteria bacterium]|nr:response regulator [Candidatus Eisenbacteria bacterium]
MNRVQRILVVDDEEPIRRGLSRIVSRLGHEVEVAADAEEALQLALSRAPDRVITDLNMPGRSGLSSSKTCANGDRGHRHRSHRARLHPQRDRSDPERASTIISRRASKLPRWKPCS